MNEFKIREIISRYKEDDEIILYASEVRITGLFVYSDEYGIRIKSHCDDELICLLYSDIDEVIESCKLN